MGSKIDAQSDGAEKAVRDIRRATRRHFSAEDKVRIVIAGLRGEDSVAAASAGADFRSSRRSIKASLMPAQYGFGLQV
jgi:hypothetical protein